MEEKTLTMRVPIKKKGIFGVTEIRMLKIRAPKMKDYFGLDFANPAKSMESLAELVSRLSGESKELISELDPADFNKISEIITSFGSSK